jgi:hypothetical protein
MAGAIEELADAMPTWVYYTLMVFVVALANAPLWSVVVFIGLYSGGVPPRVWAVAALASVMISSGVMALFLEYKRVARDKSKMKPRPFKRLY